ncbi:hypothetical protein JKP88DRAFT_207079 [Tribonema minus]|uniref:OTU domain-containing protein n=1 Tax=Tribonema minus TaxID=303371 RepID=A0A835Z5X2_9STRA|nr:hypothetical protein JKP88DRAFT_207079 [Tribonema minus]
MSQDGSEAEHAVLPSGENRDEMEKRHKAEQRELELKGRALVKQANKNKKKVAEAEASILQMRYELRDRHRDEAAAMAELEEQGLAPAAADAGAAAAEAAQQARAPEADAAALRKAQEDEEREKRRAKAQRKKDKAREKELEKERRREEERAAAGPDARTVELEALSANLLPRGLAVAPIRSDGNCLYRAVAHQLAVAAHGGDGAAAAAAAEDGHAGLRRVAAAHLREHAAEFMPFVEACDEGAYEAYCALVEGSAEWGGEVELRALSRALRVPIEVWSAAAAQPMVVGEGEEGGAAAPLRVSYHQHYYALGEHYNSVVPLRHST